MNSNVCIVTIIFLSLENVAGLICSPPFYNRSNKPSQQQHHSMAKPEDNCDSKGTQNYACTSQKLCHEWYQSYRNGEKKEEPTILYSNENQNVSFSCPTHSNTTHIQLGIINTTSSMIKTFHSTHQILNITHNGTILCCVYYVVNETAEEMWMTRVVDNKTLLQYNDTVRQNSLEGKGSQGVICRLRHSSSNSTRQPSKAWSSRGVSLRTNYR